MSAIAPTTPWHKPPKARHAQIYEELADVLDGVSPCANKLALYLYRACIGGRPEEIELYDLPLGEKRTTEHRQGKPYSRSSRRAALKTLEERGLIEIVRDYGRGVFKLIVHHLGKIRPFEKLSNPAKNWSNEQKTDRTGDSNPHETVDSFIGIQRTAEHAAAPLDKLPNGFTRENPNSSEVAKEELSSLPDELDPAEELEEPVGEAQEREEDASPAASEIIENPESVHICETLQSVNLYNSQIKAVALNFTLSEIEAAITLLREREAKESRRPTNRHGWFVECLRGRYWLDYPSQKESTSDLPPEFLAAYREMVAIGACVDVEPKHLSINMGEIQVRVSKPDREPWEPPYELVGWRQLWKQISGDISPPVPEVAFDKPPLIASGDLAPDELDADCT